MLPPVKLSCQKETIYWNLGLSADASSSKKTVVFTELAGGVTQDQANVEDSLLCSAPARLLQRERQVQLCVALVPFLVQFVMILVRLSFYTYS